MRILLLATQFTLPYRALRCIAALGAQVYVMGPDNARSLVLSRFCKGYKNFDFKARSDAQIVRAVEEFAAEHGATRVFCSDYLSTLTLARIAPMLRVPTFPLSLPDALSRIGTKDQFMRYCLESGIVHPRGAIYPDAASLRHAVANGEIAFPAILKPVNTAGGIGILRIDESNAEDFVGKIDYAPILAQDFLEGEDRSITLFCHNGAVQSHVAYSHPGDVFHFAQEPELLQIVSHIARDLKLNGVINFDARIDANGKVWMIECNPRFFFNMDVAMIAGMNFADEGALRPVAVAPIIVRNPRALLAAFLRRDPVGDADIRMFTHWLRDPLAFLAVMSGYQRRWRARWLENLIARLRSPRLKSGTAISPAKVTQNA